MVASYYAQQLCNYHFELQVAPQNFNKDVNMQNNLHEQNINPLNATYCDLMLFDGPNCLGYINKSYAANVLILAWPFRPVVSMTIILLINAWKKSKVALQLNWQ